MAAPLPATPYPPGRLLPLIAGALTQLSCGACLLIGTIGFVLVQQNKVGSLVEVAAWLVAAMAGLVFGGLSYRGGLASLLVAAAIDAAFGISLIALEYDTLRGLLKVLPASDVATIGEVLDATGGFMIGAGLFCLAALPQGIRYARWFRAAAASRSATPTARGFPPPPVPARTSAYIIPAEQQPGSRRRLYLALDGLAVAVGIGVGVLVSSLQSGSAVATRETSASAIPRPSSPPGPATRVASPRAGSDAAARDAGAVPAVASAPARGAPVKPIDTVEQLIAARRVALVKADPGALADLVAPTVFGIGVDAEDVAEGRAAVVSLLARDLGEPPPGGFTVESRALSVGEEAGHAWIAEELEIAAAAAGAAEIERRRFAITELAARLDGRWQIVALHWAMPVDDATAERRAILQTMPALHPIPDRHDGSPELDQAVRAAFASRTAFADARSERPDAFNYGSGGERARGGAAIKRIFHKLRAEIRVHDGVRVVAGSAWDPAQRADPRVGWAAVNIDFTSRTRAGTDVTQTFRVLAILIQDAGAWRIVQTQWSNGGPLR